MLCAASQSREKPRIYTVESQSGAAGEESLAQVLLGAEPATRVQPFQKFVSKWVPRETTPAPNPDFSSLNNVNPAHTCAPTLAMLSLPSG